MDEEEKKVEVTQGEEKKDLPYDVTRDRRKSTAQLAREERLKARRAQAQNTETEPITPEKETTPVAEKTEEKTEEKPAVVEEKASAAPDQGLEKKIAELEEQNKKFEEEIKKIEKSKISEEAKEEKREELKAAWAKEGRTPKDYDEIWEEASNAGFEKAKKWFEEQEEKRAQEAIAKNQSEQEQIELRQKAEDEYRARVDQVVGDEWDRLVKRGLVTDDEKQQVFQKALEVNTERAAKGDEMITSVSDIYYNFYKPEKDKGNQPAGADAPVAGARSAPNPNAKEPAWSPTDRNKSFAQLARELIRGKR